MFLDLNYDMTDSCKKLIKGFTYVTFYGLKI